MRKIMKNKLHFKSVSVKNLRCFSKIQRFNFYKKGAKSVSRCTIIIGDNGVGKTSVLRSIALGTVNPENGRKFRRLIT